MKEPKVIEPNFMIKVPPEHFEIDPCEDFKSVLKSYVEINKLMISTDQKDKLTPLKRFKMHHHTSILANYLLTEVHLVLKTGF